MNAFRNFIVGVLIFNFSIGTVAPSLARAEGLAANHNSTPKASSPKTPKSVAAKLYWIAKFMDNHENWLKISELLRETLEIDLNNDYVRARLKQVKQYVDREVVRQAAGAVAGSRLDSHSFLEARLLVVECIQELRPRLNLSWTGEVRHLKKMLFTALFPHMEGYGRIEFPAPNTYGADVYGYTLKNLKALMITRGGQDLTPLFGDFLISNDKPKKSSGGWDDGDIGSNMYFRQLSNYSDRIYSTLRTEGVDPDASDSSILPDGWNTPGSNNNGPVWSRGGSDWTSGNDDWDWRQRSDAEDRLLALKRAYVYIKGVLTMLRNHRSIDEYEPLTLMMVAVSNPALIEEDPQLKDFVAGIKFKLQIPISGMDSATFKPHDYNLVGLVNDALSPTAGAKLEFEVDSRTGQEFLYLTSNFNGSTNLALNIMSFRNVAMFVQGAKYMPEGVIAFAKATPENITKLTETINKMIENMSKNGNFIYKIVGAPAQVLFDVTVAIGGKTLTKAATATSSVVQKILLNARVQKGIDIVKSEGFLRTMVALSVATDITTGIIELSSNNDSNKRPQIIMHTAAKASSALVYLSKYKPAIWAAIVLDLGHIFYDHIPSTSEVFEFSLSYTYDKLYRLNYGYSPREKELRELKEQLGVKDQTEALELLTTYEKGIKAATDLATMDKLRTELADKLGIYAARRLVFHYVTIASLNGKGDRDLGFELRNQFEEYDRVYWTWFSAPGGKTPEQAGLSLLDRDFDEKYVKLGGKLPEKPKPEPAKKPIEDKPPGEKKPATSGKDLPW